MSRLTRGVTAEPISREQILRCERGQEDINFSSSADHKQDWQPYPVDSYSVTRDDHTYIYTIRGCQSGTWSGEQEKIRGTSTKLQRRHYFY